MCPEGHSQGKKFIGSSQLGGRAVTHSLVPNSGICYEFNNKGECSYGAVCKYQHMCLQYLGRHPACHCQKGLRSVGCKPFMASKAGGEIRKYRDCDCYTDSYALHYFSCYTHSCGDIDMHALFSVSCVCLLWLVLLMSYFMNQVIYFGNIWEDDEMGR